MQALTIPEHELLYELVTDKLTDLFREINGTDSRDYRKMLLDRQDQLYKIEAKLRIHTLAAPPLCNPNAQPRGLEDPTEAAADEAAENLAYADLSNRGDAMIRASRELAAQTAAAERQEG